MKHKCMLSVVITVVAVSIFLFALPGWAQSEDVRSQKLRKIQEPQPARKAGGADEGDAGMRINWRALKLTQAQQAQIKQYQRDFQINTATIRKELQFAGQDLRAAMLQDPVDRAKIDSLLKDISDLKQRLSEAATQNVLAIKSVLTQEQLEILADQQLRVPAELRGIQLTSEQRGQVRDMMKDTLRKNKTISAELQELKAELREKLLAPGDVDSDQLKQLQVNIAAKELALETARVDSLLKLKEILTPEQLKQLKQFRAKRQSNISDKK